MNFQETVFQRLKTLKQILSEKQSILSCSPEGRLEIRKRGKKTHVLPAGFDPAGRRDRKTIQRNAS